MQPFGPPGVISWKMAKAEDISFLKDVASQAGKQFFNFKFNTSQIKYILDGVSKLCDIRPFSNVVMQIFRS